MTASASASGGRSSSTSPWMCSGSRLVTIKRSSGASWASSASGWAAPGRSCSTLSHSTCVRLPRTRAAIEDASPSAAPRRSSDSGEYERGIAEWRQRAEHRSAVRLLGEESAELEREARLAAATGPEHGQHARVLLDDQRDGFEELALPAQEARCRDWGARSSPGCEVAGTDRDRAGRAGSRRRSPSAGAFPDRPAVHCSAAPRSPERGRSALRAPARRPAPRDARRRRRSPLQ